ncbi:hypothetical protein [Actinoalloteichus hymeniacidonis]|uniref:Ig-like domain-containing protein n=1 Tax=Actinoalloteichus hymeniacidonis TaxID=340345 RepID=A0AAC9HRF7_9PSEU|nr:hypothetical protein [Actinoalloteichus hymeniacidonis]AOS63606.1 hypothetical protein TL08_13960 [Actinoalloteichus hymeniacidonis]MBB5908347.1 hypothetical protein [Actinoalloteichus hymeniacidonis]
MFRHLMKLLATVFMATTMVTAVPTASAQQGPVTCGVSGEAGFQPSVLLVPRQSRLTLDGDEAACIDADGEVAAASFQGIADGVLSCLGSPEGTSGRGQISWTLDDGTVETSTVDFVLAGTSLAHVELTGFVIAGRYEGERFTAQFNVEIINPGVRCATFLGVDSAGYEGTFSIG